MTRPFQFDAYAAYLHLKERYASFLLDHFGLTTGPLHGLLRALWTSPETDAYQLFAPPLLEAAFPFQPGEALKALSGGEHPTLEQPLCREALELFVKAGIPAQLYRHQVETIRQASQGKTVVLSAGTGSGKTESFLIPLVNGLLRDHAEGKDDLSRPGVRAIILYPLNALVNNQVERLRLLLQSQSLLKFAFYTSRLPDEESQAIRALALRKRTPPPCEVLDRKTLRGLREDRTKYSGPPHILVTNYSMLEYLLVRPLDQSMFRPDFIRGTSGPRLRAIVLDEAHVYAGSMAADIHMLLRRTAERFGTTLEAVQGYATSATLSQDGDEDGARALQSFLQGMFSKKAEQCTVILGTRMLPAVAGKREAPRLTAPETLPADRPLIPPELTTLQYDEQGTVTDLVTSPSLGQATAAVCLTLGLASRAELEGLPPRVRDCPARLLYRLMSTHPQLQQLRSWMKERLTLPDLSQVAETLFGPAPAADRPEKIEEARCRAAHAILQLASLAREQADALPLIPSRMHVFGRSPAGVWVSTLRDEANPGAAGWPWGRLQAVPPEPQASGAQASGAQGPDTLAELVLCRTCGTPFLLAYDDGETLHFRRDPVRVPVVLLPAPAGVAEAGRSFRSLSPERGGARVQVLDVDVGREGIQLRQSCPTCADAQPELARLSLRSRVALGAIVDSIYPHLGELPLSGSESRPAGGRRLLTFSDSRQGAAEVATRVEKTHATGLARQLLWEVLQGRNGRPLTLDKLVRSLAEHPTFRHLPEVQHLESPDDSTALRKVAQVIVFREFATPPARAFRSLERSGLVEVLYPELPSRPSTLSWMSEAEWQDLLAQVLDELRRAGVIACEGIDKGAARVWTHRHAIWSDVQPASSDDQKEQGDTVRFGRKGRPQFVADLLERFLGTWSSLPTTVDSLLKTVWESLVSAARSGDSDWLNYNSKLKDGALQLQLDGLAFRACEAPAFIEPQSQEVYFRSLRGICPNRAAPFSLVPLEEASRQRWRSRHAITRVLDEPPLGLLSIEHTAQLDVETLEAEETRFKQGARNLLASSTTMEMGIDLGGLTFVLLTNVPPGPANYWQRAGRAGRRAEGSALVLTLARPLPHDMKVFAEPRAFLHAKLAPPRVRLDTRALLLRHVNASLLSAFFEQALKPGPRGNPMHAFGTIEEFLLKPALGSGGIKEELRETLKLDEQEPLTHAFQRWLEQTVPSQTVPSQTGSGMRSGSSPLAARLARLTKGTVLELFQPEELAQSCSRALTAALSSAQEELNELHRLREDEKGKGEGASNLSFLNLLDLQEREIRRETLMSFLSRTGFLPGFGFPTQVVRLNTHWTAPKKKGPTRAGKGEGDAVPVREEGEGSRHTLRMERSLSLALSEYAPGAEVIANKQVYRSAGMIPNWRSDDEPTAFRRHYYSRCLKCGTMEDRLTQLTTSTCSVCRATVVETASFVEQSGKEAQSRAKLAREIREGKAEPVGEAAPPPPQVIWRSYLEPKGFSVAFGQPPRALEGDRVILPQSRVQVLAGGAHQLRELLQDRLAVGYSADSRIFIRSEGRNDYGNASASGFGFAICQRCGFAAPEQEWRSSRTDKTNLPPGFDSHPHLRRGTVCRMGHHYWRNAVLGCSAKVDTLRIRLLGEAIPQALRGTAHQAFMHTFALLLKLQAAEMLQVDPRLLGATTAPWQVEAEDRERFGEFQLDAVLYDESASGLLALLEEDAQKLVNDTIALLQRKADLDFVLYETQSMLLEGTLRLELLREHFCAPGHAGELLQQQSFLEREDVSRLRGCSPLSRALELLGAGSPEITLLAPGLSPQALGAEGLLRALKHRATDQTARLVSRVLLEPTALQRLSVLDREKLRSVLEEGVVLRLASPSDVEWLRQTPWRVVARGAGLGPWGLAALGGMKPAEGVLGAAAVGGKGDSFGPDWMEAVVPVMAGPTALQVLESELSEVWTRAAEVQVDQLKPLSLERVLKIPGGSRKREHLDAPKLLEALGIESPETLGTVARARYEDRYVANNGEALWMLRALLSCFRYGPDAPVQICYEVGHFEQSSVPRTRKELLEGKVLPGQLTEAESLILQGYVKEGLKEARVTFEGRRRTQLPHGRELRLEFKPGAAVKSLTLFFDRGLDWLRIESPPAGGWAKAWGHLAARETYVALQSAV